MKHTIKLLTLAAILTAVFGLTGCPGPVNNYIEPPHEHVFGDWGEWEVVTAATCTKNGSKKRTRTCSCGEVEEETVEIDALAHDWVLESDTATCTTEGVKTYKCSRCNETRTEDSPAHHTFIAGGCDKCGEYQYADGIKFHLYVTTQEKYNEKYVNNTITSSRDICDDYYLSFENENSLPNGVFYYDVEEEGIRVNMIRLLGLKNLNHNSFKYGVVEHSIVNDSTFHIGINLTLENNFYIVLN